MGSPQWQNVPGCLGALHSQAWGGNRFRGTGRPPYPEANPFTRAWEPGVAGSAPLPPTENWPFGGCRRKRAYCPNAHSGKGRSRVRPDKSKTPPLASQIVNSPSTRIEPLLLIVIFAKLSSYIINSKTVISKHKKLRHGAHGDHTETALLRACPSRPYTYNRIAASP